MLGRCNIRGGFEAHGSCILSRTYCWILLKSSLLLHTCLYMPHAHGESVFTVYTIQTALHCFNSSIHILLCCKGRLERYWNGLMHNEKMLDGWVMDWIVSSEYPLDCFDYQSTYGANKCMNVNLLIFFIRPKSDHCLGLSVRQSVTALCQLPLSSNCKRCYMDLSKMPQVFLKKQNQKLKFA